MECLVSSPNCFLGKILRTSQHFLQHKAYLEKHVKQLCVCVPFPPHVGSSCKCFLNPRKTKSILVTFETSPPGSEKIHGEKKKKHFQNTECLPQCLELHHESCTMKFFGCFSSFMVKFQTLKFGTILKFQLFGWALYDSPWPASYSGPERAARSFCIFILAGWKSADPPFLPTVHSKQKLHVIEVKSCLDGCQPKNVSKNRGKKPPKWMVYNGKPC